MQSHLLQPDNVIVGHSSHKHLNFEAIAANQIQLYRSNPTSCDVEQKNGHLELRTTTLINPSYGVDAMLSTENCL